MPEYDNDTDSPEDRLIQEAEELMRQKRFQDAASRYHDLRRYSPTDLWTSLGYASALECAGKIGEASEILEEARSRHRRSAPLHRFLRMFFVRREDLGGSARSQAALHADILEEGPEDQLADLYFNQGRYHEAQAELERLLRERSIEEDDLKASVLARIGACKRQSGDMEGARDRLYEALALDRGHHWFLSELAEVERALGNIPAARRRYIEALQANPEDHWCRGHLAQMECEEGEIDRAVELYREIILALPKAPWPKVDLAQVVLGRDPAEATQLCKVALEDDPTYPWAHAQLGNLARREGRLEEARAHYLRALSCAPNAGWVLHELADICRHLGRMEEAYAHLEHCRGVDAYDATTYGYFADLLRHEGKVQEAVSHLEKAVELDEGYTWAWRELAELKALQGAHDRADAAYRRAVDLEPDEAINDGLKAFLLRCAGRRDAALPYLERAVERQGDYLWAWREQIEYHLTRQRPKDAEQAARRACVALPDNAPLLGMLADALRRQGRRTDARVPLDQALAQADDLPQLWAMRSELALEDDDHEGALRAARRSTELDPGPEYQALLAQVLIAKREIAEAEAIIGRLLALPKPVLAAFELASLLAERRDDLALAASWCDRGLAGPYRDEVRLILRRARLGLRLHDANASAALPRLFDAPGPQPWREISQIFAQANQPVFARRAAYIYLAAPACDGDDRAKGWLHLAELELAMGNTQESTQALEQALALDRDSVPGQILAAVLADQRGDLATASGHLEHIDGQLHELPEPSADGTPVEAGPEDERNESALLLRQLASLYERQSRVADADRAWQRILAEVGEQVAYLADHVSYLLRQGRLTEAETGLARLCAVAAASDECQRAIGELAACQAGCLGPQAGFDSLRTRDSSLGLGNRLSLAQYAFQAGDAAFARAQLERIRREEPGRRGAVMLEARMAMDSHPGEAEAIARGLIAHGTDEDAACLLAESLVLQGRIREAIGVITASTLPPRASWDRAVMTALIHLENAGLEAGLVALGRLPSPTAQPPIMRILSAAWPTLWPREPGPGVQARDSAYLPAFPILSRLVARALWQQRRHLLAADILVQAADRLATSDPAASRRLRIIASDHFRRLGRHRQAFREAWKARSLLGLCRAWVSGPRVRA